MTIREEYQKCINCQFAGTEIHKGHEVLVCKFHAPHMIHGAGTGWADEKFPQVATDEWCGEYQGGWI